MNTCPICFSNIDTEDLMYEVVFYNDHSNHTIGLDHEWIQKTPLANFFSPNSPFCCIHNMKDEMLDKFYGKTGVNTTRYLMISRGEALRKNKSLKYSDIQLFKKGMQEILNQQQGTAAQSSQQNGPVNADTFFADEFAEMDNKNEKASDNADDFDDFFDSTLSVDLGNSKKTSIDEMETTSFESSYDITMEEDERDFSYKVLVQTFPAFQVMPCCPHCHVHLPRGWMDADEYVPIGFFSPKGGGKTTVLESIISRNFKEINKLGIKYIQAFAAEDEEFFSYYASIKKKADELVKQKKFPEATQNFIYLPIFFNLHLYEKKVLVGLFDISGEILENLNLRNPMARFMLNMAGLVCLIDPLSLHLNLNSDAVEHIYVGRENSRETRHEANQKLKSMEEQARIQQSDRSEITVQELLEQCSRNGQNHRKEESKYSGAEYELTIDTFTKFYAFAVAGGPRRQDTFKNTHLAMTIMKSDMLVDTSDFHIKSDGDKEVIFSRPGKLEDYLNADVRLMRNEIIPKLFDDFFFQDSDKDLFVEPFGSVSWHCISAVGCSKLIAKHYQIRDEEQTGTPENEKVEYCYEGEFNPIRVVEPVLEIVFQKLGMLK